MECLLSKNIAESNASRKSRDENAAFVLERGLSAQLIDLAFDVDDSHHFKACWILELVLEKNLDLLRPRLDDFCNNLSTWTHDSALRSISKICLFCVARLKTEPDFLSDGQLSKITDSYFQWLISDEKVAAKSYAIYILYETGKRFDWVYPELISVLQHGFTIHTPAYKAAAKRVLAKIMKH